MHCLSGNREKKGVAASVDIVCQPVKSFQVTNVFRRWGRPGSRKRHP
jgi:hypothetical protein